MTALSSDDEEPSAQARYIRPVVPRQPSHRPTKREQNVDESPRARPQPPPMSSTPISAESSLLADTTLVMTSPPVLASSSIPRPPVSQSRSNQPQHSPTKIPQRPEINRPEPRPIASSSSIRTVPQLAEFNPSLPLVAFTPPDSAPPAVIPQIQIPIGSKRTLVDVEMGEDGLVPVTPSNRVKSNKRRSMGVREDEEKSEKGEKRKGGRRGHGHGHGHSNHGHGSGGQAV
jgi:hypothetical protein